MLLFAGQPRGDTKPLAKILIRKFGSLGTVLRARVKQLFNQRGLGDASISKLKLDEAAGLHLAHCYIPNRPFLTSQSPIKHCCINRLAHEPIEYLIMLCPDNRNRLIAEGTMSKDTVDETAVYERAMINAALKQHAQAAILVHNHPNCETTPPPADIKMTDELQRTLRLIVIALHDRLIVAGTR